MPLKVAFQMDPVEGINVSGDSTLMLILEAERRGHTLYHYLAKDLSLHHDRVIARMRPLHFDHKKPTYLALGQEEVVDLRMMDLVLMRQDPPFDMAYITATHLLEHVAGEVLVLNDPVEVRNAPEKLFVTRFPQLMPPTLITTDPRAIGDFRVEHRDIIVKPLYGNGGAGVFHIKPGDENLGSLLEMFGQMYREPIIAQRYLPEVREGDKRIILIDGEPAGAVARIPADGEARANLHVGGAAGKAALTERDLEICRTIGPTLRDKGLVFVGIDVIGNWLTEINVTSPTGIQHINRLEDVHLERDLWDCFERRLKARRP